IEVDSRIGAVVELDEVLLVGGAGVAAAAVDLGDDDAGDGLGIGVGVRVATALADVNGRSGVAWRGGGDAEVVRVVVGVDPATVVAAAGCGVAQVRGRATALAAVGV